MHQHNFKLNKLYQGILCCSLAISGIASAQDDSSTGKSIDEVVVTGSYLKREKFDMASPVETISAIEIQQSGYSDMGPYLRDLTYTANVDTVANVLGTADGQQDSNSARFNLRGLGTSSTLTLFDGRRVLNSGAVSALVPDIALSQVDVILDGGAALYGTDAVAGVVNLVPIQEFDGFKISGYYNKDGQWTSDEQKISVLWGKSTGKLDVVAALEYGERSDPIYRSDRPKYLRADNDSSPLGNPGSYNVTLPTRVVPQTDPECGSANDGRTDDGLVGSYPSGIPALPIYDTTTDPATLVLPQYFCTFEYGAYQDYKRPYENMTAFVSTTYQLNDHVALKMLINHNDRTSTLIASPSTGEIGSNALLNIGPSHPENPFFGGFFNVSPFYWRPFSNNGATQPSHLTSRGADDTDYNYITSSIALGTEFEIGNSGWSGEAYYSTATTSTNITGDVLNLDRLQQSLEGRGGVNGNQWFNPFFSASTLSPSYNPCEIGTAAGCTANDQGLVDWLYQGYSFQSVRTDYSSIEGFVSGDLFELPAGAVQLAVGGQVRKEHYKIQGSPFQRTASTEFTTAAADGGPANLDYNSAQINGVRGKSISESAVQAVFFETLVPILDNLELNLAARYEDFKDLDVSAAVPKISLRYTPIDSLSLRVSAGKGFLAPTLSEITAVDNPSCGEVFAGNDPALDGRLAGTLSCSDGNPQLDPEESTIYNIGATWKATDDLEFSLDYQQIDYQDRIIRLSQVDTLSVDLGNFLDSRGLNIGTWNDLVENDPAAAEALFRPWVDNGESNPDIIRNADLSVNQVTRKPGNVANVEVDVVDLRIKYGHDFGNAGYLTANWSTTWYSKYDYLDPFGNTADAAAKQNGQTDVAPPISEFNHQLNLGWIYNNHNIGFTVNHASKMEFDAPTGPSWGGGAGYTGDINGFDDDPQGPSTIKAFTVVDFRYGYEFQEAFNGRLNLSLGANNVFDKEPQPLPVVGGLETRTQDPTGRTYYVQATYSFE